MLQCVTLAYKFFITYRMANIQYCKNQTYAAIDYSCEYHNEPLVPPEAGN